MRCLAEPTTGERALLIGNCKRVAIAPQVPDARIGAQNVIFGIELAERHGRARRRLQFSA